ncbi:MAG: KilA-N domain-containing protein [Prevotella sp.]|nr:KilA-N domain-containing protein [Prevotella sp.]
MAKIIVQNVEINVTKVNNEDYICLTDMIKAKDGDFFVTDWLRNRNTMEYLGIWENLYNPNFNYGEFATINELICLSNMENIRSAQRDALLAKNAVLINDGMPQGERLVKLNQIAIQQMQVLEDNESRKLLK